MKTRKKKFVLIGKVGTDKAGKAICFKHWTDDVEKYLNRTAPKYKFFWINFFYNTGPQAKTQFLSWTKNKGLFTNIR
jgi:hypothetical protein